MAVQIYQNEELNDIMFEIPALEEWKALATEMGMENQLEFVRKAETPIPYPNINRSLNIVFKTLCPMAVDFRAYTKTPIPLEVMKQLSMSINDKHFQKIEIWYDDKKADPVAVGVNEKFYAYDRSYNRMKGADNQDILFDTPKEATSYAELTGFLCTGTGMGRRDEYLIARWADELRPIEELRNLAKERLLEKYGAELRVEIEEKSQALKMLTDNITKYLNGDITGGQLKGDKW